MSSLCTSDRPPVFLIAGPTASGKSALALRLAEAVGGEVINADAMQVYRDLQVLTDRPGPEAEARVPHRLYGVLSAAERGSAAWWLDRANEAIVAALDSGRPPILCGGTGFYLKALSEGLAAIPPIPEKLVRAATERYLTIGGPAFVEELRELDPQSAARLDPGDGQRLQRAWSVATATGRALSDWQADGRRASGTQLRFVRVLMFPPRPVSAVAVDRRFRAMVQSGAIDEVDRLRVRDLDRSLPAMKALGVPQILAYLEGHQTLEAAIENAVIATRQYAKRQRTWFRHQFVSDLTVDAQFSESMFAKIFAKIRVVC